MKNTTISGTTGITDGVLNLTGHDILSVKYFYG